MNELLQEGMDSAGHFLSKRGEFFPFAVAKAKDGQIVHIQAMMDNDRPNSEDVIASIVNSLRSNNEYEDYMCIGIVSDVGLTDSIKGSVIDAVRVQIEDCDDGVMVCYASYSIYGGRVEFGDVVATTADVGNFF